MEKSKFGVSIGLTGAAMFFLAIFNSTLAGILAAYVLLKEDNDWLRKSAVKMFCVISVAGIAINLFAIFGDVFESLDYLLGWIIAIDTPFDMDMLGINIINGIEVAVLFILGLRALTMGTLKIKIFDRIIGTHM